MRQLQQIVGRVTELARPVVGLERFRAVAVAFVFPVAPGVMLGDVAPWDVVPAALIVILMLLIQQVGGEGEGCQRIPPAVVVAAMAVAAHF